MVTDRRSDADLGRRVEVSVVLPSRDEEETIEICISKIRNVFEDNRIAGEIIVADNSQDSTPIIATKSGARVITPDRRGYGYAYSYAFKYAKGEIVVLGDADDTYDFMEMPMLLEPLRKGNADLVIGSRFRGKIEEGAMPWHHRWVGNPVLTWFLNLFFKAGVSDAHSGFRAIKKEALEKLDLEAEGMEFASEMIVEAARKGLRIEEVPISYYRRRNGNSKLSSLSDGWRHLKFMLLHAPNYLFVYPGSFLLLAGLFFMLSAFLSLQIGYAPGTRSMIAGSLLTTAGYQIILFGLFASIYRGRGLPRFFSLEKGATMGTLMFLMALAYLVNLLWTWYTRGLGSLPSIENDILAFTLAVLGIQTVFSSFMLSLIAKGKKR